MLKRDPNLNIRPIRTAGPSPLAAMRSKQTNRRLLDGPSLYDLEAMEDAERHARGDSAGDAADAPEPDSEPDAPAAASSAAAAQASLDADRHIDRVMASMVLAPGGASEGMVVCVRCLFVYIDG